MAAVVDRSEVYASKGMLSIKPAQGLQIFDWILKDYPANAQLMIINCLWPTLYDTMYTLNQSRLATQLLAEGGAEVAKENQEKLTGAQLISAPDAEQLPLLETYLGNAIGTIMGLITEQLEPGMSLYNLGLDSLTAVEIKNRLETDLEIVLDLPFLLQGPTISDLAAEILEQLSGSKPEAVTLVT
jgi:acyl carrier protein